MWELINDTPSYRRLKVPGGWLVQLTDGTSPIFISDISYSWLPSTGSTVVPTPTPNPVPLPLPVTAKWFGTNLTEVRDWSTDFPFINFFYRARKWIIGVQFGAWDTGVSPTMDSQGNILSLPASNSVARCILFSAARPIVDFDLTWTGSGTVSVFGATVKSTSPNHLVITPNPTGNVWIEIMNIDPTNPPKNWSLKRVDQATLTGFFNPDFIADISKYACIRFMDWSQTNYNRSPAQLATDFAPINALPIRFSDDSIGVPLSVQIALCNAANTNGWFNININADATYISQFLNQISSQLAPGLKAYIELSNEVWNGMFPQNNIIAGAGATFDQKMNAYALRAADLAAQTKTILGSKGISILGSQDTVLFWQEQLIKDIQAAGKTVPNCISIAPYFGLGISDTTASFDSGALLTSVKNEINNVIASKKIADKYGLGLVCYEGGCSVEPGIVVNRDPRIGPLYTTYLNGIKAALSGNLFNHYAYISAYGSAGSWGEKEYQYQTSTAKSMAISGSMK